MAELGLRNFKLASRKSTFKILVDIYRIKDKSCEVLIVDH